MNETQQILQMLQEAKITVEEATQLLLAIEPGDEAGEGEEFVGDEPAMQVAAPAPSQPADPPHVPPDMARFRRLCQIPFVVALCVLAASGWGLYALCHQAEARITLGFVAMLILFVLAIGATAITFWMRLVPWLHVRVREQDGKRIAISLPLPLTLASWGVRLARRFVEDDTAEYLDASAELLKAMKDGPRTLRTDPIVIDIDDDGQRVQVFIG